MKFIYWLTRVTDSDLQSVILQNIKVHQTDAIVCNICVVVGKLRLCPYAASRIDVGETLSQKQVRNSEMKIFVMYLAQNVLNHMT